MTSSIKTVILSTPDRTMTLGKFVMDSDGIVTAHYHNPGFRKQIENGGIYAADVGTLKPEDGPKFMDNLRRAFSNSSTIQVVDGDWAGLPVDREDAWSEEARAAALETRRANAKGAEEKPSAEPENKPEEKKPAAEPEKKPAEPEKKKEKEKKNIAHQSAEEKTEAAVAASKKATDAGGSGSGAAVAALHEKAAKMHSAAATEHRAAGNEGKAKLHEIAAALHGKAAESAKASASSAHGKKGGKAERPEKKKESPGGGEGGGEGGKSHLLDILHLIAGQKEGGGR